MDLFLQPQVAFIKMAGTRMPEDPNAWPQEVLQQLFKEVPYMSDFSPHVTMDKVDGEKGYAFGYVTVMHQTETQSGANPDAMESAGLRQVRVPVLIKDGELYPLDLLVTDDAKVVPLTESRLREAVFRPQAFDVTAKTPGDQSMIGQLYPPYRQNYGFGGGGVAMGVGMGKEGSSLEAFLTEGTEDKLAQAPAAPVSYRQKVAKRTLRELCKQSMVALIAPTMNDSDVAAFKHALHDQGVRLAYEKNAAANYSCVKTILEKEPNYDRAKVAELMESMIRPDVIQLSRVGEGYVLKTASHNFWAPVTKNLTRAEALEKVGSKMVFAADTAGSATMVEGESEPPMAEPDSDMQGMGPISSSGMYKVLTTDGKEAAGYVIPNLIDIDGLQAPVSLFTNGANAAVQGEILGIPVEGGDAGLPTADAVSGSGAFVSGEGGELMATVPMNLQGSYAAPGQPGVFTGTTWDGRPVEVSQQPNIQMAMAVDGRMLVPAHWKWMPLGDAEAVDLAGGEEDLPKEAAVKRSFAMVDVVSGGETFSFRGPAVEKLAHDTREFLSLPEAMFLLGGLGVNQQYGIQKLAESLSSERVVQVKIGRALKTVGQQAKEASASAAQMLQSIPALRQNLFKEAAFINDPEALDTVLSLGFINPENITTFISYLPKIDETQERLCNLLFASRLGLADIPETALQTAVRSVEEVIEGLKTIAFQGPAYHS